MDRHAGSSSRDAHAGRHDPGLCHPSRHRIADTPRTVRRPQIVFSKRAMFLSAPRHVTTTYLDPDNSGLPGSNRLRMACVIRILR